MIDIFSTVFSIRHHTVNHDFFVFLMIFRQTKNLRQHQVTEGLRLLQLQILKLD